MQLKKKNIWIASLIAMLMIVVGTRLFSIQAKPLEAKVKASLIQPRATYNGDQYVTNSGVTTATGTPIVNGGTMNIRTEYKLFYEWELPDNTFKEGDVLVFSIPKEFTVAGEYNFPVYASNGAVLGNAQVVQNSQGRYEIQMTMTHHIEEYSNVKGRFELVFVLNDTYVKEGNNVVQIPGGDMTINVPSNPGGGGGGTGVGKPTDNGKKVNNVAGEPYVVYTVSLGRNALLGQAKSFDEVESIIVSDKPVNQVIIAYKSETSFMDESGFYEKRVLSKDVLSKTDPNLSLASDDTSFDLEILPSIKKFEAEEHVLFPDDRFTSYWLSYKARPLDPNVTQVLTNNATITVKYKPETGLDNQKWVLGSRTQWNAGSGSVTGDNGQVRLIKHDSEGNSTNPQYRLSDAEFDLYKKNENGGQDTKINQIELVTDTNGIIEYKGLTTGQYYFKETKAPIGYEVSTVEYPFEITKENMGAFIEVVVPDDLIGKNVDYNLELQKTDDTGKALAGAEFQLKATDGSYDQKKSVNASGKVKFEELVPEVTYQLKETKAPVGYKLKEETYTIVLDKNGNMIVKEGSNTLISGQDYTWDKNKLLLSFSVKNIKEVVGGVELVKVDSENKNQTLAGAKFDLYRKDGSLYKGNLTTDANGKLTENNLPLGDYYFIETQAPSGYETPKSPDNRIDFSITEANATTGKVVKLEQTNKKTGKNILQVEKRDKSTNNLITNGEATFIIQSLKANNKWQMFGEGQWEFTTKNGVARIEDQELIDTLLEYQGDKDDLKYRFREIKAPAGYKNPQAPDPLGSEEDQGGVGDEFSQEFKLDKDEPTTVTVVVKNEKEKEAKSITLKKTDADTDKAIPGVEFVVQALRADGKWDSDYSLNGQKERTFVTDSNGLIVIDEETYPGMIDEMIQDVTGSADVEALRFRETKAPSGYTDPQFVSGKENKGNPGDQFSVELNIESLADGSVTNLKVDLANKKKEKEAKSITLKKTDADTGKAIPGVEFVVQALRRDDKWDSKYILGGVEERKFVTNSNGLIVIDEETYPGMIDEMIDDVTGSSDVETLRFRESKAPSGYTNPQFVSGKENKGNPGDQFSVSLNIVGLANGSATNLNVTLKNTPVAPPNPNKPAFTLKKTDASNGQAVPGAVFELQKFNQQTKQYEKVGSSYTTDSNGEIQLTNKDLEKYWTQADRDEKAMYFVFNETKAPNGYEMPYDTYTPVFKVTEDSVVPDTITKENKKINAPPVNRGLTLKKVDDKTGEPLQGAKFLLYYTDSSGLFQPYGSEYTTDENGEINLKESDLKAIHAKNGNNDTNLIFNETTAPNGYELPSDRWLPEKGPKEEWNYIRLTATSATPSEVTKKNAHKPVTRAFSMKKVSDDGKTALPGAKFELHRKQPQGNYLRADSKVYTTNAQGQINLTEAEMKTLGNGTYKFYETEAPKGYETPIGDAAWTDAFVISEYAVKPTTVTKKNVLLNRTFKLIKQDEEDNKKLAGAEFVLEKQQSDQTWKQVDETIYKTNAKGEFELNEKDIAALGTGTYRFKETKAPEGYQLPTGKDVYTDQFVISANKVTPSSVTKNNAVIVIAKNFDLELLKVNDKGNALDGAEFTLVPSDHSSEAKVSSGTNGLFSFKDLEVDLEYTLTETKAPNDYFINKTPYTFILKTDEDPAGKLFVYYDGKLLEEGKDYEWDGNQLKLSLVIVNHKTSMPITGSIGILGLLIAGSTAIGLAYNFQVKKKKAR